MSLLGVVSHQDRVDNAALGHDTRPLFIQSDKAPGCGALMMIMVIMMMGDDQDLGLDPVQRRSVFFPQCVQMFSNNVYSVKQLYI